MLIIGSVSGNGVTVVELAMEARRRGVRVIGITGKAQSENLDSLHPSGKKLSDVAEVALDNHTVHGDAVISVEGLPFPICPFSGIGSVVLLWATTASLVEKLLARGIEPTVFRSVHLPGGQEQMKLSEERYARKGY